MTSQEWGAVVKAVRTTRGLSQTAVAEMVGCKQPTISLLERGVGTPETRRGVARALGIQP